MKEIGAGNTRICIRERMVGGIFRDPEARSEGRAGKVARQKACRHRRSLLPVPILINFNGVEIGAVLITRLFFIRESGLRESIAFGSRPWDLLFEAGPSSQGLERCLPALCLAEQDLRRE